MVRSRVVLNLVLNELEAWQPNTIKREVICSTSVGNRQRRCSHVLEWSKPVAEERSNSLVALQINSADLPSAVVEIEVATEFFPFRFLCQNHRCSILTLGRAISGAVATSHSSTVTGSTTG